MPPNRNSLRSPQPEILQWSIDDPAPSPIAVGRGSAVPLYGWCFHRNKPIRRLRLGVGHGLVDALAHSLPRPDVYRALHPGDDVNGRSYASGFYAIVPLPGVTHPTTLPMSMHVDPQLGRRRRREFDKLRLEPNLPVRPHPGLRGARVVICMATYNPPYELFARQIESIVAQSSGDWRCVISDDRSAPHIFDRIAELLAGDDRFVIDRSSTRLGAYHNFERSLALVGDDAELVALADQDDWWYPEKLEVLESAIGPGTMLAYSDCRIVSPRGELLSDTFFPRRRNQWRDFRQLLLANTVTGAAAMFRRSVLDDALPFPPAVGKAFHDHWLAIVALASGGIEYVERPLYDYIQHDDNLLGHTHGQQIRSDLPKTGPWMLRYRGYYREDLMRVLTFAHVVQRRLGDRLDERHKRVLHRLVTLERSNVSTASMASHAVGAPRSTSSTLGAERDFIQALLWRRRMTRAGRSRKLVNDLRYSSTPRPELPLVVRPDAFGDVKLLINKIAPLELSVSSAERPRINVLVPHIDLEHFFGGYITKFNLAARLSANGNDVRIVAVDANAPPVPDDWRERLHRYEGLSGLDQRIELADASQRWRPLAVSPRDVFIATTWWTAHIAHHATNQLGHDRFLYVIQEYEPLTFPAGSFSIEAEASYRLPHYALFSTEPLRDHFREHRLGVFRASEEAGEELSLSFENAITPVTPPSVAELEQRTSRRLLFYARPEPHASRNMFELGLLALTRAAEAGWLDGWEINGVGAVKRQPAIELGPSIELVLLHRFDQGSYADLLRSHDAGVALMATPHPSLVPLEMAAAGLRTVTNSWGTKQAEWLEDRSSNLIVVEPTLEAITLGIKTALELAPDHAARTAGAAVDWPMDWSEALNPAVIDRVGEMLASCAAAHAPEAGSPAQAG